MKTDSIRNYDLLFDNFVLQANGRLTFHGQDLAIPPKELQVLITLLEARGNLVHKNLIIDKVWGDTLVGDESLTRCIYSLRRLLRESKNNRFIDTVYGKGYRLCKTVTQIQHQRNTGAGCKMAIFPFYGLPETEAEQLHGLLLDAISSIRRPGLSITPGTLTQHCSDPVKMLALCHQLGLDFYLTGARRQGPENCSLTVELIDAGSLNLLYRGSLSCQTAAERADQMQHLAGELLCHLPDCAAQEPLPMTSAEVLVSHVIARRCLRRREPGDLSQAMQYLQMGLLQDPYHLPSLISMAETWLGMALEGQAWPADALGEARKYLETAITLQPEHPSVLTLLAWHASLVKQSGSDNIFFHAQSQARVPADLYLYQAMHLFAKGETEQSLSALNLCLQRDDGLELARTFKLWVLYSLGRDKEALVFVASLANRPRHGSLFNAVLLLCQASHHGQSPVPDLAHDGSVPAQILQTIAAQMAQADRGSIESLLKWRDEARTCYRCPGLLAWLARLLREHKIAEEMERLAEEQHCLWLTWVRHLSPRQLLSRRPATPGLGPVGTRLQVSAA